MKKLAVLLCFVVLCVGADSPINYEDYKAIRAAAQQGDANAQYNMGVIYDKGYKVKQSYSEALSITLGCSMNAGSVSSRTTKKL